MDERDEIPHNSQPVVEDDGKTLSGAHHRFLDELDKAVRALDIIPISMFINTVADQAYTAVLNSPVRRQIDSITTKSGSGTCTITGSVGGTNLSGTANSVSTTKQEQEHGTNADVLEVGEDLILTVSSNAGCADLAITVKTTRIT